MNKARRERLVKAQKLLDDAFLIIEAVCDEEWEAYENLPEGLQNSERGQQISEYSETLDEIRDNIGELVEQLEEIILG